MVLAELIKRQRERRSTYEGAAKMHRLWTEWLRRKEAAESAGEPFNEPPPQLPNGSGRDS